MEPVNALTFKPDHSVEADQRPEWASDSGLARTRLEWARLAHPGQGI